MTILSLSLFQKISLLTVITYLCLNTAEAAKPCCADDEVIRPKGSCGNATERININCTVGHMLLKDVFIKGSRLYTKDAPEFSFASDPNR